MMFEAIDYKWILAGLATTISVCNLIYYITTVLKGKTKPHMYTWLIWGLVTGIAGVIQLFNGGGAGAYFILWVAFASFVRFAFAIPYGEKDIKKSDKIAFAFCLLSIVMWQITQNALVSLVIVTLIDVVAFFPTFRKSFMNPHEENLFSFALMIVTLSLGIMALEAFSLLTLLYPVAIVFFASVFCLFLIIRRKQLGYKVFT